MWIGAENVQTNKILLDIQSYLNGLDNIVMADDDETEKNKNPRAPEVFCEEPVYGHFIVVINKMMGGASDIELQKELMEPEPGITLIANLQLHDERQSYFCLRFY